MGACGNTKSKGPILANHQPQNSKPSETFPDEPNPARKDNQQPSKQIKLRVNKDTETDFIEELFEGNLRLIQALQKLVVKNLPRHAEFSLLGSNGQDITAQKDRKLIDISNGQDSLSVTVKYLGLDLHLNPKQAYSQTNIIGAPKFDSDPLELIAFDKRDSKFRAIPIRDNRDLVKDFGYFSSICNAKNSLFISGGERDLKTEKGTETELMSNFVSIDLNNGRVKDLKHLIKARSMHSMIWVPDRWIFIVGGTDTRTVDLYDIDKNTIALDSMLNEDRSEPSLAYVKDDQYAYLYAFCGFKYKQSPNNTIERCNLQVKTRYWEEVVFTSSGSPLNICFFATCLFKDDKILILGGNESNKSTNDKTFSLNWKNDTIDLANVSPIAEVFNEKFFMPMGDGWSALMPMPSCDQAKVLILRDNGKMETLVYQDPAEDNVKSSFKLNF
jgi:hypothetical protein